MHNIHFDIICYTSFSSVVFHCCSAADENKSIIDIRLCPSPALPMVKHLEYTPFSCCLFLAIMSKHSIIHKNGSI